MVRQKIVLYKHFSSHGNHHHYLQTEFRKAGVNSRYFAPIWRVQSGGLIDPTRRDQIIHDMGREFALGSRQVHVICLLSNNLRDPDTEWTPQDCVALIREIVLYAKTLSKIHVVICGILPTPANNDQSFDRFSVATSLLKKLSNEHKPLTSFVNIPKAFNTYGVVCSSLFTPVRQVHLTEDGAEVLARILKNHLENWPKKYF